MRLYCLASISRIPPPPTVSPKPYDENADEMAKIGSLSDFKLFGFRDQSTLEKLPSDYRLTEIVIGYIENERGPKTFELGIYQTKSKLITFKMLRGFATITFLNKEEGFFDLYIATSKLQYNPSNFDLKVCVFCIRNPNRENESAQGLITSEEEFEYSDYAKRISNFCKANPNIASENLRMEILQQLGPLVLPNSSTPKVFKQRLTDFENLITLLCHPVDGSFKNVTLTVYNSTTKKSSPSRIYQIAKCLLFSNETMWRTKRPSTKIDQENQKFRDCTVLRWQNIYLNKKIDFSVLHFQNLKEIQFSHVYLGGELKFWHKLAERINFTEVSFISLQNCGIQKLDDEFFVRLTPKLSVIRLMDNDIRNISNKISKLTGLFWLDLCNYRNLIDIPWSYLPSSITRFELEGTNIFKIPKEAGKLKKLEQLYVSSSSLNHIDVRASQSHGIKTLKFCGAGAKLNDAELRYFCSYDLTISNLKISKLDFDYAFRHFSSLHLINNYLNISQLPDINYDRLTDLTISGNGLEKFSFKHISKRLRRLNLTNNELEAISSKDEEIDFSSFIRLKEISLKSNSIEFLPIGFENLPVLEKLDLSYNNLASHDRNVTEKIWNRIPKSLISLNLTYNQIDLIPCCLKNFKIENLFVADSNLHYICPYLHTHIQKTERYMVIDVRANCYLQLSFIPNTIYPFPNADVQQTIGEPVYKKHIPNYANFPTTTLYAEKEAIRNTGRISKKCKSAYAFKTEGVKNMYACKCCAKCGNDTENSLFQQVMVMDSVLLIKIENGIQDEKMNPPPEYYEPGQWKSKITSRLCDGCKEVLVKKIENAFENEKNGAGEKKKKKGEDRAKSPRPFHQSPQTFYNIAATPDGAPGYSTSSTNIALPPINTLLHNSQQQQKLDDNCIVENATMLSFDNNNLPYNYFEAMEIEENPVSMNENYQNHFVTYNIPQATILLDQDGNQIYSWGIPSNDDILYSATFLNQNYTTLAFDNLEQENSKTYDDQYFTNL